MATFIPNRTGEAIQRASENLINMILQGQRIQMERQRLGMEERRLGMAETQLREGQRASALQRVLSFAPFIQPGKTIAEVPELHESMATLWPEFDPADPAGFGGIELNPQTLDTVLRPMAIAKFQEMSPEDQARIVERRVNREVLGIPASGAQLTAEDARSNIFLQSWETLRRDPVALEGIMRQTVGLQQPIRVNYQGRTLTWDSAEAANISVRLMLHQDEMNARQTQLDSQSKLDLAGELMEQMEKAGAPISRPAAMQVVSAYSQRAQLYNDGKLTVENDPLGLLVQSDNPDLSAAAQFFIGAGQIGERSLEQYLQAAGPAGQQIGMGIKVSTALKDSGIPAENMTATLESVLDILNTSDPTTFPRFESGFWGGERFQITAPTAADVQGLNTSPADSAGGSADPNALVVQTIKDVVGSGRGTREQAVAKYGEELVNRALGAGESTQAISAGNSSTRPQVETSGSTAVAGEVSDSIRGVREEITEVEREIAAFMAPVEGRPAAQVQARRNSARAKSLDRRIERLRERLAKLEAM
jgi:hypothetical protein